ncbi:DNA polymerase III subunit delta [Chryseobacterium carnipullorum]|uniref:DNA polymerase III subunit delta n=1 Tax=Chryseobacterium carnipullorum TaxID=1124835 RepID=A0A376E4R7_CHRCU|nr:DNA polymerase III subunit delta [Chryseobacterium carnipullorum]AZA50692.1 DNA polymerase III subunit delta [Chryseobacterium carnipullorum]AZA65559.1 DNA polymerase III subunit delta [Chryseobacterium carnipullorum]STD01401.1 DNA polymerase III subunit delta [Chryseobacterium carnipullorum]
MKELDLILKNIKNKEVLPIYFFHGEEPYFIDAAVKVLEHDFLEEDEKAFNQTVVYGKDTSYHEILSLARQFPMMGDKQLIIVKEAQDLKFNEEENRVLEAYVDNPVPSTVLVFAHKHKKLDSRKKATKALDKAKALFLSESVRDSNLPKWIADECTQLKIKTAPNIAHLLAEYLGNDLSRIANELNKLKIILKEGEILDGTIVENHIGISKEYNVFELQKALGTKNADAAFRIAHFMGKNPKNNPFVMMLANLYSYFSNVIIYQTMSGQSPQVIASQMGVNPYFIKDYAESARLYPLKHATRVISILREFDMKGKGLGAVNMGEAELIKELVYKIINIDKIKMKV